MESVYHLTQLHLPGENLCQIYLVPLRHFQYLKEQVCLIHIILIHIFIRWQKQSVIYSVFQKFLICHYYLCTSKIFFCSTDHVPYSIGIKGCLVIHNAARAWTSITAVQLKLEYTCIYTWYPTYVTIGWCILKSRDVFTFSIPVRIIVKMRVLYICGCVARNAYSGPEV